SYERNLERLKESKMIGAVTALEDELREVRRQLRQARKRDAESSPAEKVAATPAEADPSAVIRQAYLRTLGRLPDERETGIAGKYFSEAGDPAKGVRDLLWALLNTKEFITNH